MNYTYRFIDFDGNFSRVGYTSKNLKERIEKYYSGNDIEKEAIKNALAIEYTCFETIDEAYNYEGFLLNSFKPKYNDTIHEYRLYDSFNNVIWKPFIWYINEDNIPNKMVIDKAQLIFDNFNIATNTCDTRIKAYNFFNKKIKAKNKNIAEFWGKVYDHFCILLINHIFGDVSAILSEYPQYVENEKICWLSKNGDINIHIPYMFDMIINDDNINSPISHEMMEEIKKENECIISKFKQYTKWNDYINRYIYIGA